MAVVSFKWIGEGRTGGGDTIDGEILRTRIARVRTNNPSDGEDVVLAACSANGAALGDAHPDNGAAYCQRRNADNSGATKIYWTVLCHYSNKLLDNPLNEPAKIKVSGQLFTAPILFDASGNLITNSAGYPLVDPAPEADFPRRLVTVRKNIATPDLAAPIFALQNTLNQQPVTIWPTYGLGLVIGSTTGKLREVDVEGPEERNGITYFVLALSIDWRAEGWDDPLLDAGYQDIYGNKLLELGTKTEPSHPLPLDGAGLQLTSPGPTNFFQVVPERYLTQSWAAIIALI